MEAAKEEVEVVVVLVVEEIVVGGVVLLDVDTLSMQTMIDISHSAAWGEGGF